MSITIIGGGGSGGGVGPQGPQGEPGPGADQSLNTTDDVQFNSVSLPNGTQVTEGSFDNSTGGQNGISLHCAVGYELNWQGGHLRSVMLGDENAVPQPIHFDSQVHFHGGVLARVVPLASAATLNTDASAGDIFDVTLTGNATLANPTNGVDGQTIRWRIKQDASGGREVTLGSAFATGSQAVAFSTAANKTDVLTATFDAASGLWLVIGFVSGIAPIPPAPRTLYFNGAVNADWSTLGNWWDDDAFTIPATSLPTSIDSVKAYGSLYVNTGSVPTVVNLDVFPNSEANYTSFGVSLTVTDMATFHGVSYLVGGTTITGNATFSDTSMNGGHVTGTATFIGSAMNSGGTAGTFVPNPPPEF